jgi:HAMP domain-containing protein
MAYLQNIDELFVNELTVQKDRLEGSLVRLAKKLKKNGITRREVVRFVKEQRPSPYGVYLVASSTGLIANHHGSLKNEEVHESFVRGFANDRIRINTMRAMYKIGTYVLASLNKQKISTKAGTEAEMVCEALTQRSPADLIRMFADRGTFSEWGMGSKRHQTYVNMLQLFSERYFDYSLFYVWESDVLELEFIRRIFHNLNRNELGLRVSAVDEKIEQGFPQKSLSEPVLKQFALKLRDRSLTRPEFCRIDGIDYLLVGHKCVTLANIRLLGLYPMAKIEALVADKSNLLRILALVSLLVSVALSLFVAGSILRPLSELQAGVKALEERDFAWRVPDLGGDEFGHLAQIFNATLIDLEEMHAASQVQEKLLSRMEKPQNFGCFKFFCYPGNAKGNNVDYFDLLDGETGWRSIMFGRACARGVAGSLVLAFVKSAGLRLQHLVQSPGQFAATLNALLLKSSSNSVHAMELQNFLLLPEGKISYAGGGLSVMLLFDSNLRCVKVLKTDTIPLGELADRSFQTVDLQVSSGQALVVISMLPGNLESWLSALNVMKTVEPEEICRSFTEHCRVVGVDVPALLVISCV